MMSNDTVIAPLKEKIDDLNQQAWETRVNDSPKAFQLSEESVKLARSINYSKGLAEGLRSLGFCYVRLFKNDEAAPLLRESLSLFQSLNDRKGQAIVYEYLGIIERNWGNLGASLELLLKGNELVHQTGPLEAEVTSCYQVGVTYKHLGNHDLALDYLYKSLSLSKEINLKLMEAYAINIIGSIYFDNGNYKDALDCYQQGLVIRQQSHDKWGEAGSLDNIGFTYLKLNDLDKAIDYCKQSLQITQSTDDKKGEANTLLHLAEIYKQAGDIGQASTFSNESLEIRKLRGDKRGEAEVLLFIADLNKNSASIADRQIFEWISIALNIAGEIKAQDLLSKAYFNLHEYYTRKGNYKESLVQLEAHLGIEKELHKNTISQKVQNLEISYKAEEIKKEAEAEKLRNKELTELNEQIEKVNEELKIEASLERVRTTAMAMKEPADMLHVCRTISDQLLQLGFKEIRNVQTVIIYPQKHEYINYQYFTPYNKSTVEIIDYRLHPDVLDFTEQMLRSPNAYYTKTFEGEELNVWREYRKQTNQLHDPKLDEATSSHYYFYSIGSGALGVTTYAPLSEQEISLFKRFRNVFELAYRRFIDIEKAQAQAREAQIEAALERVRAKSMAMHHSDDLISVINVVQEQLLGLGFRFHGANFVTAYSEKGYTMWLASPAEAFPSKIYVPQIGQKYFEAVKEAIENGSDFATYTLNFEEKNIYFKNLFEKSLASNTSEQGKRKVYESKGMAASVVLLDKIRLNLMNLDLIPFTDEENTILRRFGYVFEQSYTRFLDLQKAEAQAREAQIEAALERVRSKTMAMHKSEEITGIAVSLNEELLKLDFAGGSTIIIMDRETGDTAQWTGFSEDKSLKSCYVPYFKHPCHDAQLSAWKKGEEFLVYTVTGDEKRVLDEHYFTTGYKDFPESDKRWMRQMESVTFSHAFMKYGAIHWGPGHLTEEQLRILQRFSKVFEQSYTRFLDLQKAETQTREAKIEAALERVRSRTMAMHKSEELLEVVAAVFKQMQLLGFNINLCNIILFDKKALEADFWVSTNEQEIFPESYHIPYFDHPFYQFQLNAWKKGEPLAVFDLEGETKKSWEEILFTQTDLKRFPASLKQMMKELDKIIISSVATKHGLVQVIGREPLSNEYAVLLSRFAKVFEQTYTRFLDLQKAEAQAREAQIEVALERIRARAMAMHSSNELMDVAHILREQMGLLDQPDLETSVVNLFEEDSELIFSWNASRVPGSSEKIINSVTSFPKNSSELTREMMSLYHSGEKEYTLEAAGLKLIEFLKVLIKANPRVADYMGSKPPEKVFYHFTTFAGGNLLTVSYQPPSEETKSLQRRAASVFDMAYRRYLDLKKAEAQAREAQVEAAVEKVRSRSLAMHKSDELQEVVHTVFERLKELHVDFYTAIIILFKEGSKDIIWWLESKANEQYSKILVSFTPIAYFNDLFATRESGGDLFSKCYSFDQKNELFYHLFEHTDFKYVPEKQQHFLLGAEFATMTVALARNAGIQITSYSKKSFSDLDNQIVSRFSNVFDQAYTRFLDLQKAEAQAREAQIELALERVRAKAMAMQEPAEFVDVINIIGEQFIHLDFDIEWVNFGAKGLDITDGIDAWNFAVIPGGEPISSRLFIPRFDHPLFIDAAKQLDIYRKTGNDLFVIAYDKKNKDLWLDHLFAKTIFKDVPVEYRAVQYAKPGYTTSNLALKDTFLSIGKFDRRSFTDEQHAILKRFGNAFGQAYTRFLDLQKAEAQAREAQIEAALERVRSRSMAMHKSDELREVVAVLFAQLQQLGFDIKFCTIALIDKIDFTIEFWLSGFSQEILPESYHVPNLDHPFYRDFQNIFQQGIPYHVFELYGEEKKSYDKLWFTLTDFKSLPEPVKKPMMEMERVVLSCAFTKNGMIQIGGFEPLSDTDASIVQRFAKVFEQTHTRFLDLQKAEAQAREAQIEAALERVRAKVMAMTNSNDLDETSLVFGEQLRKLGIDWQFSYFWLVDEAKNENTFWITWPDYKTSLTSYTLAEAERYFNDCLISWRAGVKIHDNYVAREAVKEWLDTFQRIADDAGGEAKRVMVPQTFANGVYYYDAMMKYGSFGICISKPATDEEKNIQCRFAIEFERAYTRFLDLQKAEAQARESQIELGLERVRARAMAMQKSNELAELVDTVFKELTKLHFTLDRCIIIIIDENSRSANYWMANPESITPTSYHLQLKDIPLLNATFNAWKERTPKMVYDLEGDEKSSTVEYIFSKTELKLLPAEVREGMKNTDRIFLNISFNNFGGLQADTIEPLTEENLDILYRFSKVFDLTYTRFNDLKQAEAQARESQIELGLERVRARAMAMQKSDELKELIGSVSTELSKLDIILDRCFILTYDIKTLGVTWWMANPETSSDPIGLYVKYHNQAPYIAFLKAWQDREMKWQYILEGEVKKTWDKFLFVETELSRLPDFVIDNMRAKDKVYLSASFNNFGCLTLATIEPLSDEQFDIMLRFAKVFDLTYTRFNDLKQAEAQTRAAKIEAALERVRARALAMQEPEELKEVAFVLRTEMGLLGVEELETCSIYINDESAEKAECWYALKDARTEEKKLVNDHFALNLNDTWVGREMLQFYNADAKQISIIMTGDNRKEWILYCEQKSVHLRGYYGDVIPDRTYHLYKFSHGAIGVATPGDISGESWDLLKRAASVFSLAYSRFKDLTQARTDLIKLKEEKKRAEDALTELQVTQKQLIQSEKMASLGELTAGIAHEIQNPLNFVNNFSDVSNELLEEMKTELATGNTQQAIEIVNDVKENLEKILHHGKRADAIVKSMLQHSRSSTGKKEPTDINSLTEEYFGLAFHALRAKDKSFNARFETDLDKSIGKVNIISQDVGRVILNLINNAFYAVNEKKSKNANGYEPVVTVSTKKMNDKAEIRVKDNGDGIPQKVLDKIFQPFFTTKPTGQGTGLGLSLSYDIITKGHGGELFVKTKEGEGTEFIISLPVN